MSVSTDQKPNKIIVSPKDIAFPTTIRVSLGMPDGVQTRQKLTYFDRIVEDAVGTLYEQGFHDITPEMVCRQIYGTTTSTYIHEEATQKVDQSIMKMAATWTKIDCTEQLRQQNKSIDKGTVSGMLLQGIRAELKMRNGQTRTGWRIHALPMIFNYSKTISQVATLPIKVLNTESVKNTPEMTQVKYYLIAQVERIRKKPEMNKVLYKTIFETIGDTTALSNRRVRSRRIKLISEILNDFVKQGYILRWKETTAGQTKDGILITCAPKMPPIEN